MTNEKYTEEFQKALNDYIKLGFNQDECNGFMHGFHKGAEAQQLILPIVSQQRELLVDFWMNLPNTNKNKGVAKHYVDKYLESTNCS